MAQRIWNSLFLALAVVAASTAAAQESSAWPRTITSPEATVVIYQPQVDRFEGDELECRTAVAVTPAGTAEPVFGAVWMTARVETDRDARLVRVVDVKVDNVRLPDASDEARQQLATFLEREIPRLEVDMDLDLLVADLGETAPGGVEGLKHDPPRIIVRYQPAVLILVDGEPSYRQVGESSVERVVNTPYLLARYRGTHYLSSDNAWFEAQAITGPWRPISKLPAPVGELAEDQEMPASSEPANENMRDDRVPEIVVSFAPAELVFIDGDPKLAPIGDGGLLNITNTDSDVVFVLESQTYFVLLSGRWYRGRSLDGPWDWVANDELPEAFANIPDGSDLGYLRTSVAGTDEAREAILDQVIPQTTAIRRDDSSLVVTYDGAPSFADIESRPMQYAVNTASAVILYDGRYYVCDQGVWYEGASPTGPWWVCGSVPDAIYTIPPSSPVYNVTYVRVYSATPQVVYVGYTPGYLGSYVSHGSVVYGTGWYYRPWWGSSYYSRPVTWGYHVRYNPWYGWSFGLSYSTSPFTFMSDWGSSYYGAWWGPGGYRSYPWYGSPYGYGYRAGYRHGYWHSSGADHGQPGSRSTRPTPRSEHPGFGRALPPRNIYTRDTNRGRVAQPSRTGDHARPVPATGHPNNVITDRDGNVYRRSAEGGWERREAGAWRPSDRSTADPVRRPSTGDKIRQGTDSTRPPSTGRATRPVADPVRVPSTPPPTQRQGPAPVGPTTRVTPVRSSTLDRAWAARQRGQQRAQTYRSAPPARTLPPAPRPKPSTLRAAAPTPASRSQPRRR